MLTAFATTDLDTALVLTVICAVATPLVVVGAAFNNSADDTWRSTRTLWRAGVSLVAFAVWSITIPTSGWNKIDWFAEDPARTAVIVGIAGFAINLIASGVDKRIED